MTDRDALLRAIAANPDDDTPRLMCADLLDELGGDANAARARFIRVQIDLARNAKTNWFANADRICEVSQLAGRFADKWLDELPNWAAVEARKQRLRADDFPRGFIDTFHVRSKTFAAHGHQLLNVAPVTRIIVSGLVKLADWRSFAYCPHLLRIRSLTVKAADSDGVAAAVRDSPVLGGIETLSLSGGTLTDAGAAALAKARDLGNLRVLTLAATSNRLTEGAAESLLGALWLPKLTTLDIRGAPDGYRWREQLRLRFPEKTAGFTHYLRR